MQTSITVARLAPGAPLGDSIRTHGTAGVAPSITVLNGFARKFAAFDRDGAFSLKWIPRGAARCGVERLHHRLHGDKLLLLHPGQPYEVEFEGATGTESFCLFFATSLLENVLADYHSEHLEGSGSIFRQGADVVFTPPPDVYSKLWRLRSGLAELEEDPERLEETLLSLLYDCIAIGTAHCRLADRVPGKRASTRRRLLARVQRARELIDDRQGRPISLQELAAASGLSKFHLLRCFQSVFGSPPAEFAEQRRMARAVALLKQTPLSVGQIAERLGYQSQSAFGKSFRRLSGVSPRQFRARLR